MRLRFVLLAALALGACNDDDEGSPTILDGGSPIDAASPIDSTTPVLDAAQDAAVVVQPADCSKDPKTYLEIINACTDAEKVTKNPVLPLLGADGKLPPLP